MGTTLPQVHYVGSFDDGTVFDSSREVGAPYEFLVGGSDVVPGFSEAVAGLGVGQSRRHTMTPADAYGARYRFCTEACAAVALASQLDHRRQPCLLSRSPNSGPSAARTAQSSTIIRNRAF